MGLVTARCPLGSSAWTWVSSTSTAGTACSCEWCVRDLTYCCPLPTHGERQPEPRGIPFMPHCNRHHRVLCRPDAAPVPGLEEESVLVLQVSTTSVHLWFMLGIVPARVGVEVRVWRRLWVISSGRLPDAAPHGCILRCACLVSGGRDGLCVHGKRVIALEAPVTPTISLRGDLSVAVPGCNCLQRPRTSDHATQR